MHSTREVAIYGSNRELIEVDNNSQSLVQTQQQSDNNRQIQILNEIEAHVEFRNFTDKIDQLFKIDHNSFLLRYLEPLQQTKKEFYEFYLQTFTISKNMRTYVYDARNTYNAIISDFNAIRNKLCMNMPNLVRMVDDFNEFRIKTTLTSLNYNTILERLDKNIDQLRKDCKPIRITPIDNINESEFNRLFGTQSTMVQYTSIRGDIKIKRESMEPTIEKLNKIVSLKSETDSKLKFCEVKLENLTNYIKSIEKKIVLLRNDLDLLNNNISQNDRSKLNILNKVTDEEKFKNLQENLESQRKTFNDKFINTLDQVSNEQANLINDIKNISHVMKKYHLIFILDESGSMSGSFECVQESVHSILTKRKSLPVCTDKVSIIKFDDSANIETLNADIKDDITVDNMRGGGTSFVKALDKFQEVLDEINSEKFVAIVFFLSDGHGESQDVVLGKCQEINNKYSNYDIIFFTVGFSSSADSSTLEKMSRVFNKGNPILKIGEEMCKLYYSANNTNDLKNAFTMYEKFFEYQKDLISYKQNMLKGHIHNLKEQHDKDKLVFDQILTDNELFYKNQLNQAKERANDLGDLNIAFNQKIADLNEEIGETNTVYEYLNQEKAKLEQELKQLEYNKNLNDTNYVSLKDDLDRQNDQLNNMIKNENEEFDKMIESQRTNIEANLSEIYNYLNSFGVGVNDDFKRFYRNFQNDYFGFEKNRSVVFGKSMDIVNYFTNIIDELKQLNQYISEMICLIESNSKLSASTIGKIIDKIKTKYNINSTVSNDECIRLVAKQSLNISDFQMDKFTERFDYILNQESAESIICKLLDKRQADDVFDMIRAKITALKDERDEIKDRMNRLDLNNNPDSVYEKENIDIINNDIKFLERNKPDIERIIRKISFIINEGKELYIQKILNEDIKSISDKLMLGFFENMNNMNNMVNISAIKQPIKLGISY